jgi:hypothetical protein
MRTQSGCLGALQSDHFVPQNRQSFAFKQDDRTGLRADLSVGTPWAVIAVCGLESHLSNVGATIQAAYESACHKLLAEMIKEMVEAFVDAKMEGAEMSVRFIASRRDQTAQSAVAESRWGDAWDSASYQVAIDTML